MNLGFGISYICIIDDCELAKGAHAMEGLGVSMGQKDMMILSYSGLG